MDLRTAIIEQWCERFAHDTGYAKEKIRKVKSCRTTSDLLYHCMNIDCNGLRLISEKLNYLEFEKFLWDFQKIDQSIPFT